MEEDFYKVWTAEEYDKQPRPEGWHIDGLSEYMEEGPPCAVDAEDAATEWAVVHMEGQTGIATVVVVDEAGHETRWTLHRRVKVTIDAERVDEEGAS